MKDTKTKFNPKTTLKILDDVTIRSEAGEEVRNYSYYFDIGLVRAFGCLHELELMDACIKLEKLLIQLPYISAAMLAPRGDDFDRIENIGSLLRRLQIDITDVLRDNRIDSKTNRPLVYSKGSKGV